MRRCSRGRVTRCDSSHTSCLRWCSRGPRTKLFFSLRGPESQGERAGRGSSSLAGLLPGSGRRSPPARGGGGGGGAERPPPSALRPPPPSPSPPARLPLPRPWPRAPAGAGAAGPGSWSGTGSACCGGSSRRPRSPRWWLRSPGWRPGPRSCRGRRARPLALWPRCRRQGPSSCWRGGPCGGWRGRARPSPRCSA